jgi:D-arabinose 1-dehydrogenase-like Zn-dependent alcohol dehydrogenase
MSKAGFRQNQGCHLRSDLHTWLGTRSSPTPIILGHEIMGEIVELGTGVSRDSGGRPLKIGDRITWTIMDSCGKCYYCREKGLMMKCLDLKKYGHDSCASPPHSAGSRSVYVMPGTCVIKFGRSVGKVALHELRRRRCCGWDRRLQPETMS